VKNKMKKLFLTIITVLTLSLPAMAQQIIYGKVTGVIDGDTIEVTDNFSLRHTIRLAGIDAPEVSQPGGIEAETYLRQLTLSTTVYVTTLKNAKYDQKVGRVVTDMDGVHVNYALLAKGHAWFLREYADELGIDDRLLYQTAEQTARARKLGLWLAGNAMAPWDYRQGTESNVTTSTGQSAKNAAVDNPNVETVKPAEQSKRPAPAQIQSNRGYIRGPRGGCYTITSSGRKRYVDRSLCN
jgi:endonuclease YncB( thermonuclease family)